jgi:threonine dehydrogenase-like Zn-dependent dehydrogenase
VKANTYKAAMYRGIGKVDVADIPYPSCGDGDAIVKNLLSGICGTDIGALKHGGDSVRIWKDSEFGHEMVSEVVEIGKDVQGLRLGDYVFPNADKAKRDRRRVCTVGGFSEYVHIPQCEVGYSVIKIDKGIPLEAAVLLEPFVVGAKGVKALNPGQGKTAIVFGAGIIGIGAAIMLKWHGCGKVMIVDISEYRLEKAKGYGLIACNSAKEDLKAKAVAEFGASFGAQGEACGANLYVDALGLGAAVENFAALAARNANLAVIGIHHKPVSMDYLPLAYNNWHIHGCGDGANEDYAGEVLDMMRSGRFDLAPLVSHKYGLGQIEDAIAMAGNANAAQKVCIAFADGPEP